MDFYNVNIKSWGKHSDRDYTIQPGFIFLSKDIICKGGELFAFWYEGKWRTSKEELIRIIDGDVWKTAEEFKETHQGQNIEIKTMTNHSSGVMKSFQEFTKLSPNSDIQFNQKIIFSNEEIKREDYTTTQLSYSPSPGDTPAFDEMFNLLYDPEELKKILWFIGAVLTNQMMNIQKFLFLYGGKGTGKGTALTIFKHLFEGYYSTVDLKKLTSGSEFATSGLIESPLLIDDDTDLYSIRDDTNLLKLTGHDTIVINNKYQTPYDVNFKGLLVAASNQPYKVRNVDSGITRRAIVASPSNNTHDFYKYNELMKTIEFELPHIAYKAIEVFESMGSGYYEDYVDMNMLEETDHFYNFMTENHYQLGDVTTLKQASELYKIYLEDIHYDLQGYKLKARENLKRYYKEYYPEKMVDGNRMRNVFIGLKTDLFKPVIYIREGIIEDTIEELIKEYGLENQDSLFDDLASKYPAQIANKHGVPSVKWDNNTTTLSDIDTKEIHYVQIPHNHIVIDLDIKNEQGDKDLYLNLKKVKELGLPLTYMETSKSGEGIHLHYIYEGKAEDLDNIIEEDVEIKVMKGNSSLRRKLVYCNNTPIARIATGLPEKEEEDIMYKDIKMISWNEQKMRTAIKGNMEYKYHANTRPSVDFIVKIFDDAEKSGVKYDLRDMRQDILSFASSSTNQASYCIGAISKIKYSTLESEDATDIQKGVGSRFYEDEEIHFYDNEVFSNLFMVGHMKFSHDVERIVNGLKDGTVTKEEYDEWKVKNIEIMINPDKSEVEAMVDNPIVGFNNRRYDNHIMYAAMLGENNLSLYRQSQRIINDKNAGSGMYGGAYEMSYTDIYDYSSAGNKKSLKKWQVELGINHNELNIPWDQPVPEDMWDIVADYCRDDVFATHAVFNETKGDYNARKILSELSGLSMNATTNQHSSAIIFEGRPKWETDKELVYTDLSEEFPGYEYSYGKSTYRDEEPGEGGYVHAEPGVYKKVGLYDAVSMHPTTAIRLNIFGKYTAILEELVAARVDIKRGDLESAGKRFNGRLKPFLKDKSQAKALSDALKTVINSVYGLTSAGFDNQFKHPLNVDNIVAKRGALFMIDLKRAIQDEGYRVIHVKTDSIKVPDTDEYISDFINKFGAEYGYEFEHEATYDVLALVNKAAYIGKDEDGKWEAIGAMFKEPYVHKSLFSNEVIEKEDLYVTKEVKNASIYLGNTFVGRLAEVYASHSGQEMKRVTDDKEGYVSGTKGHKWKLATDYVDKEDVDMSYYDGLKDKAIKAIEKVGDPNMIIESLESKK